MNSGKELSPKAKKILDGLEVKQKGRRVYKKQEPEPPLPRKYYHQCYFCTNGVNNMIEEIVRIDDEGNVVKREFHCRRRRNDCTFLEVYKKVMKD